MIKKTFLFLIAVSLFISNFASVDTFCAGAIVIDDFSVTQIGRSPDNLTVSDPFILGGHRDLSENYYFDADVHHTVSGHLYCQSDSDISSYVRINYDGEGLYNYGGLGHLDLTDGGTLSGFELSFTSINTTGGYIGIEVYQEGKDWGWLSHTIPTKAGSLFFAFDDFQSNVPASIGQFGVTASTFDFTDVGYMQLFIRLDAGGSCAIDSFEVVPEPATLLILGIGAVMIRRRQ